MKRAPLRSWAALPGMILTTLLAALPASCAQSVGDDCDDVDTSTDPANCGGCGNACPAGSACEAGACVAGCGAGLTSCDGGCVDLETDQGHCGACGAACPDGTACAAGACQAGCTGGLTLCGGLCVDTTSDVEHCGACDAACEPGGACVSGACQACPAGQTQCGAACVDTQTSPQHCGGCGLSCASGSQCVAGTCQSPCDPGLTYCNGACVDTQTSQQHCGFCSNACAGGQACVAGGCVCPSGGACGLCGVTDLGSTVPQTVSGDTTGAVDAYSPQCTGPGSGEAAYSFTAPADGTYIFDTSGSGYDTVLAAVDPASCGELACNDDFQTVQSKVSVPLVQGESVVVVVDGFSGDAGPFTLHVGQAAPAVCPTADIGSTVPQTVTGTTINAGDALIMSCGAGPSGDASYTFTAPADGAYSFDTFGSLFNTVIHVLEGGCAGAEIACNDDASWNGESKVTVDLLAGQTVVIGVEGLLGAEGDFVLHVNTAIPPVCPGNDLGSTVPQTVSGTTAAHGDAITPGCGSFPSADDTWTFTAPSDGVFVLDTAGSAFNTVLSVRDGCAGLELACNDDPPSSLQASLMVQLTQGQTVVVSVDGAGGEEGAYTLLVDQFVPPPCPIADLGGAVPQTINGDTTGKSNYLEPTCGTIGGPDVAYSFTAPAAGMYTFDTFGTLYDTILHVHDGTCLGPELACNDDAQGTQSQVTVQLAAGQTVMIAVDGFGPGNEGPFVLHIN